MTGPVFTWNDDRPYPELIIKINGWGLLYLMRVDEESYEKRK